MKLPKYNAKGKCEKCGGKDIANNFYAAGDHGVHGSLGWKDYDLCKLARIERHCRNCSFEWAEAPLDKKWKS